MSILWYFASALCCIFGLDVKPHMIGMPISFVLFDRAFLSRSFKEMFQRHKYFYAFIAWVWIVNVGDLTRFVRSVGGCVIPSVCSRASMLFETAQSPDVL